MSKRIGQPEWKAITTRNGTGGQTTVEVETAGAARFFRLEKP